MSDNHKSVLLALVGLILMTFLLEWLYGRAG